MLESARDPEAELAADALGAPPGTLRLVSREPLGAGTVAGFHLPGGTDAIAYVDTSLLPVRAETGLLMEGVARLWMHPADPHLPALAPAAYGHAVGVLLARLGFAVEGAPTLVGYRPGRRAVLRVPVSGGLVWVKVVRPSRVEGIVGLHGALRAGGLPVPAVRGWSPEGLIVLDDALGTSALTIPADAVAFLDEVDRLRAELAAVALERQARTSILARRDWYAERLRSAMPRATRDIDRVVRMVAAGDRTAPAVGIHGDLHIGQLFLGADGRISGVIDVDTAGLGDPAEDAAAFIGHSVASAALTRDVGDPAPVWRLADEAWARWSGDPGVPARSAVHLLGHALAASGSGDTGRAAGLVRVAASAAAGLKSPLTDAFAAA